MTALAQGSAGIALAMCFGLLGTGEVSAAAILLTVQSATAAITAMLMHQPLTGVPPLVLSAGFWLLRRASPALPAQSKPIGGPRQSIGAGAVLAILCQSQGSLAVPSVDRAAVDPTCRDPSRQVDAGGRAHRGAERCHIGRLPRARGRPGSRLPVDAGRLPDPAATAGCRSAAAGDHGVAIPRPIERTATAPSGRGHLGRMGRHRPRARNSCCRAGRPARLPHRLCAARPARHDRPARRSGGVRAFRRGGRDCSAGPSGRVRPFRRDLRAHSRQPACLDHADRPADRICPARPAGRRLRPLAGHRLRP